MGNNLPLLTCLRSIRGFTPVQRCENISKFEGIDVLTHLFDSNHSLKTSYSFMVTLLYGKENLFLAISLLIARTGLNTHIYHVGLLVKAADASNRIREITF